MNPPPTFLRNTHIHTHTKWNRDCCTHTSHSERAEIYQRRGLSTSPTTHTHTHQYLGTQRCTTLRVQQKDNTKTIAHHRLHTAPSIEQVREMKVEMRGKRSERQKWEEEMVWREAGDDEREELGSLTVMAFKQGCFVSSASLLLKGSQILPSVPQNTLTDPSLILPSARGKHPGHCLLFCACVCVSIVKLGP